MNKAYKLLIATHNLAKFESLKSNLTDSEFEIVSLADCGIDLDVEETGTTLEENALLKAKTYCTLSGLPTIADDSGLEIDALGGEPGVYSARYAGPDATDEQKVAFLLNKMKEVPLEKRTAQFRSAVALCIPGKLPQIYEGVCSGLITTVPRGPRKKGFPYCVIFEIPQEGKTIAELLYDTSAYPDHRRQAFVELKKTLIVEKCAG